MSKILCYSFLSFLIIPGVLASYVVHVRSDQNAEAFVGSSVRFEIWKNGKVELTENIQFPPLMGIEREVVVRPDQYVSDPEFTVTLLKNGEPEGRPVGLKGAKNDVHIFITKEGVLQIGSDNQCPWKQSGIK